MLLLCKGLNFGACPPYIIMESENFYRYDIKLHILEKPLFIATHSRMTIAEFRLVNFYFSRLFSLELIKLAILRNWIEVN